MKHYLFNLSNKDCEVEVCDATKVEKPIVVGYIITQLKIKELFVR